MRKQVIGTICLSGMLGLLLSAPQVRAEEVTVKIISQQGLKFDPADVTIKSGDTIRWTGDARPTHQLHTGPGPGGSGDPITGDFKGNATHTFPPPGSGQYHCIYHDSMVGTITVK
jgi:plastocyanin